MKKITIPDFQESIDRMNDEDKIFVDRSLEIQYRIHEIMTRKGILQKDIADKLGKHEEEIIKWLSGMHNFTLRTLSKLEYALGEPLIYCPQHVPKINTNAD